MTISVAAPAFSFESILLTIVEAKKLFGLLLFRLAAATDGSLQVVINTDNRIIESGF